MNDFLKIFQEAFEVVEPSFYVLIGLILVTTSFKTLHSLMDFSGYSLFDYFSDIKESIFYREKFTCRMDAEKCAVFEDEKEIDFGKFKCSEHCEHYGKCVNCMFYDYEEDKYICGKCHHRQERRKLKPLEDVENEN